MEIVMKVKLWVVVLVCSISFLLAWAIRSNSKEMIAKSVLDVVVSDLLQKHEPIENGMVALYTGRGNTMLSVVTLSNGKRMTKFYKITRNGCTPFGLPTSSVDGTVFIGGVPYDMVYYKSF